MANILMNPVAQTFIVDGSNYPSGVFLSSIRLFFVSKPTTTSAPITLYIASTLNGVPTNNIVDNSTVVLYPSSINVSASPQYLDSTTYTTFTFPAPVYIQPNVSYAIVVRSPSADYVLYLATQNATALPSSAKNLPTDATPTSVRKITTLPYVGAFFESQNSQLWVPDLTRSMMFVINQCKFDTTQNPNIQFVVPTGLPTRKSTKNMIFGAFQSNTVVNLDNTITTGNVVSDAYNITTTDLLPGFTNINYTYNATLSSTGGAAGLQSVTPGRYGLPTMSNIYLNDGQGERILVSNSNTSFSLYASLSSSDPNLSPMISDDGLTLFNIQNTINNLPLSNSQIVIANTGSGYFNTNTISVTVSSPDISGGTQAYANASISGGNVISVYVTTGGSGYLKAPTITINDSNTTPGSGATVTPISEFSPSGGNAIAKYITKKVILTPGNDSGDLRVYLTAYRPTGSQIYVFYKILNASDTQNFAIGNWQIMTPVTNIQYFSTSLTDVVEFQFAPGINNVANNYLSYTSTNGTTYTSFIQFAIKIIMTTNDNTNVPYLSDVRALALPPGTGI
jgi:hypothetical protein